MEKTAFRAGMVKLFAGLRPFSRAALMRDAIAGVTLASMNIPQLLGYARIAGMPLVTGLYTALLAPVAFAVFGSSRHLVVAADSGTAAILASELAHMAQPGSPQYLALGGAAALLTAGMLLLARMFKLGFLADFLSRTVLVGFLAGVGVQVAIAMLGDMLGIDIASRRTPFQVWQILAGLGHTGAWPLALSIMVVTMLLLGKRLAPHVPIPLIVVIAAITASKYLGLAAHGVAVIGPVAAGAPAFGLPAVSWTQMLALLPVAASCFAVIIAQSAATSRAFATRYHEDLDVDADILGLAAANAVAALGGAFVVNGSPTQTAMGERAGARGQAAQFAFAASVLVVLLFLTGPLQDLPRCVLAAIVFTIAIGMVDLTNLSAIRRESPGEFWLALTTTAAVAAIGVEQGVLLAVGLSLLRHVQHSYQPHNMVMTPDAEGRWLTIPPAPGAETEPGLILYRFGADLFYANANRFADEVRALVAGAPDPVRWLIVEAAAIGNIDYSAARTLLDLLNELKGRGVTVLFARVGAFLRADMDRHGITAAMGEGRVFGALHEAVAAVRAAGTRATPHAD